MIYDVIKNTSRYITGIKWPYFYRVICFHLKRNEFNTDENQRLVEKIMFLCFESLGLRVGVDDDSYSNETEFLNFYLANGVVGFELIKAGTIL